MPIRILIVDDHEIFRDGLCSLITKQMGMEVIDEAKNGREAIRIVEEKQPDVIIMDLSMPEMNGISATREIVARFPHCKIVALSMHSDKRFIRGALQAGASGFLLKDCAFKELTRAVEAVYHNQTYLSSPVARTVLKDYRQQLHLSEVQSEEKQLTLKEIEALQLIAEGMTTKQIAQRLHLSVKTIEGRRRQLMEKLEIDSLAGLIKYAIKEGIIEI